MNRNEANIADPELAIVGLKQIEWARPFMPALSDATRDIAASGVLDGRRVGIILTLEPKTASLALALDEAGATVSVFCSATHTSDSAAAALASRGVRVYARSDADSELDEVLLNRFIDNNVEFLIDDGAGGTRYIHTTRRDALPALLGVAEETTSGVRPLRVMESEGALEVPAIAVNDARVKQLFDNVYGTGQSVVMTIVDVTNTQLQGKRVVVVGYGWVGKGIARFAHALGARVVVTEIDPIRALQAIHDGYAVTRLDDVCPEGDVFITATGIGYSLTGDHMRLMKDGAIVAIGGAGPPEIDLGGLNPVERGAFARAEVRTVPIGGDRSIFLIADGECVNVSAGEGNPIEIMDLSLAAQMRAVQYLATNAENLENRVYSVPNAIDDSVARSLLRALGAETDEPSEAQQRHAACWLMTTETT